MGRMSVKLLISSGLLSALLLLNPAVLAVGLGSVEVETHLNEPLRAQIPLQSVSGIDADEIEVSLGSPEEFSRVGIDRPAVLTQLSFELERTSRGPVIRVNSDEAISEPFLSFLVRVSWPQGRLLREYTILLDPPVTAPAAAPQPDQAPSQVVDRDRPMDTGAPDREQTAAPDAEAPSPGGAGERDAAAPTGGGSYGPVASGETLWGIAERLRPDSSISMNQMMLALLRTNPEAFFRDNINALRRGAVLRVPDRDQIRSLDGSEALQAVRRQNDLWQDHRRQLAEEAPTVVAGGEPQERAPVDEGSGDEESGLELVPPREGEAEEGAAAAGPGSEEVEADREALREELARTREDLLARREENTELDGRVDELEAQVERLQRLLELKNEELAALQQAEGPAGDEPDSAGAEPAPEDAPAAADTGPDAAEAPDEADAPQEAAEDSADAPALAEAPDTAGEEPEPGAEPEPETEGETQGETEAEEEPEPAAPPPPPGGGWMELLLSPVVLGIAGLLLIGIGVALFLHRRGGGEPELTVQRESLAERMTRREQPAEEAEEAAAGADDTEFGPPESGPADYDEPALRAALEENPEDTETRLKLIRHYAAAGDRESFIAQAETLYADLADPGSPAWLETRELGEEIAPDHELFGGSGGDIRSAVTGEQETVGGPAAERPEDAEPAESPAGEAAEPSGEQASGEELPDLDFETPAPEEPATEEPRTEQPPREESAPESPDDEDREFDLSGLDLGEHEEQPAGEEEPGSKPSEREAASEDSFEFGDTTESSGGAGEDEQEPLEFDLSDFETESEGDAGAGAESDDWMTESGDETAGIDRSESEPETAGGETMPDLGEDAGGETAPGPEEEAGGEAAPEGGDDDAVNTKLELAEAYMDMSDEEGAREMLEEVLSEGDEGQQKRAREMLDKLS